MFCANCYVQSHMIGPKKRHYFMEVTYDPTLPESVSTWNQPNMADVPERENSFIDIDEDTYETSSDSSFGRAPVYSASKQVDYLMADR